MARPSTTVSPALAAQTVHAAEVAVTALALAQGAPDTVAMTFSFFPLGFLYYALRGGSKEEDRIDGNAIRGVLRGAVTGALSEAEYEEFAIALVEFIMVKFGQETLLRLCRRKVGVTLGKNLMPVPATSSPASATSANANSRALSETSSYHVASVIHLASSSSTL